MLNNPLLSTAYLAPISYYAILLKQNNSMIEYHEHFIKKSIRNRCDIMNTNGRLSLSIPVNRKTKTKTKISKIKISYAENWQKNHWKSIVSSYNSSPFFEYYKDKLKPYFLKEEEYLIDFNNNLQKEILALLKIKFTITYNSIYKRTGDFTDLRDNNSIKINTIRYDQVFMEKHKFINNLSIIDLLFNMGPESLDYLHQLQIKINI
ncbi:MAG: WbqC family protein [Flavobacteriales bacterium]|nr:WbqC family protein [Flavobacteriales bacterium]MDG2085934.1 WbqC family protein [Flavobacteriales bacterium]